MIDLPDGASLEVRGIDLRFAGIRVLQDMSFTVKSGSVHAIIGPNGAGKSSLFNVLCGLYKPSAGTVLLDGQELLGRKPHRIAQAGVGRAFQNASMFSSLSVEENLLIGRHQLTRTGVFGSGLGLPSGRREERRSRETVHEVATFLGIDHLLEREAGTLPYGEAKRVDVARALCTEPSILLLDEPAAGMHTHEKATMRTAIKRIASELGTTILLVEHDMGLVISTSDRITALDFGTVLTTGSPAEVSNDQRVIEAYLGHSRAKDAGMPELQPEPDSTVSPPPTRTDHDG